MIKFKQISFYINLLIFTFLLQNIGFAKFHITQPKGWDCINDSSQLPETVECLYIGAGKSTFRPTINVAYERTDMSLSDYFQKAKNYHQSEPETTCQELGSIKTKSGEAKVLQIDRNTGWGMVRFIQASIILNQTAYVITATCLREEFGACCPTFFETIQSFEVDAI